jgi:hypothetical protein
MAQSVVVCLEAIEFEAQQGTMGAGPCHGDCFRHPFLKQCPVRQLGQRVVARHERQRRLRAASVGDVLVGRDPSTASSQRLRVQKDSPAVGKLVDEFE